MNIKVNSVLNYSTSIFTEKKLPLSALQTKIALVTAVVLAALGTLFLACRYLKSKAPLNNTSEKPQATDGKKNEPKNLKTALNDQVEGQVKKIDDEAFVPEDKSESDNSKGKKANESNQSEKNPLAVPEKSGDSQAINPNDQEKNQALDNQGKNNEKNDKEQLVKTGESENNQVNPQKAETIDPIEEERLTQIEIRRLTQLERDHFAEEEKRSESPKQKSKSALDDQGKDDKGSKIDPQQTKKVDASDNGQSIPVDTQETDDIEEEFDEEPAGDEEDESESVTLNDRNQQLEKYLSGFTKAPVVYTVGNASVAELDRMKVVLEVDALQAKTKALKERTQKAVYKIIDFGSTDAVKRDYVYLRKIGLIVSRKFDPKSVKTGELSKDGTKITLLRDPNKAEASVDAIKQIMTPVADNEDGSIKSSSWSRHPSEYEQKMIAAVEKLVKENPKISFEKLTQKREAMYSHLSITNLIRFKDPNNKDLAEVTHENVFQWDAGKGATQSWVILPKQTIERAGTWVESQLKKGKDVIKIKDFLKAKIKNDLNDKKALEGKKFGVLHGLYAIALSHDLIVKTLGVDKDKWMRAQTPKPLTKIIDAFKENLKNFDQKSLTPAIATLAALEAFQEQYGDNFSFLNMKEDMPLFDPKTKKSLNEAAKICIPHGVAVEYFNQLQDEKRAVSKLYKERDKKWIDLF